MQETPLWITITGFVLGPTVVAAFLTYIFSRLLNKQKSDLDEVMQRRLNEQKAGLDEVVQRRLNEHAAELKYASERRTQLEGYIAKQREAIHRSYLLVFEQGAQALPGKLLELLKEADVGVLEPLRAFAWAGWLRRETTDSIYEVHNFLRQAIPRDGQPPSPQTILRLRDRKDGFVKLRSKAIKALNRELETREEDRVESNGREDH